VADPAVAGRGPTDVIERVGVFVRARQAGLPGPAVDLLLAAAVTAVMLASLVGRSSLVREADDQEYRFASPDAVGLLLVLACAAPLLWRRRAPVAALVATCLGFVGYQRLGYAPPPLPVAALVTLYTVSVQVELASSIAVTGTLICGVLALAVTHHSPLTDDEFLVYVISVVGAWLLGCTVQLSRARLALAVERAEQTAMEQDLATAAALHRDRAGIARELHDVVAHHVGVIVAQAGATLRTLRTAGGAAGAAGRGGRGGDRAGSGDAVRTALVSIESAGREAMVEMRRMLEVLEPTAGGVAPPRLDGLEALVARTEQAGLPVELRVRGAPASLPAAVQLAAYRIVQESLTNALKHAGATRVEVDIEQGRESLLVRVRDRGAGVGGTRGSGGGRPAVPDGRGIVGMRQRVAALRGSITVGPHPDAGFEVLVELPVLLPPEEAAS
jgi:signal transduction histidine kinase